MATKNPQRPLWADVKLPLSNNGSQLVSLAVGLSYTPRETIDATVAKLDAINGPPLLEWWKKAQLLHPFLHPQPSLAKEPHLLDDMSLPKDMTVGARHIPNTQLLIAPTSGEFFVPWSIQSDRAPAIT